MTNDKGILIRNIFYMLTYAFQELRRNNYEKIAGEDFDNIYDLFAEILACGISYQLKQGLHRDYVQYNDTLSALKGKLDINSTIRNFINRKNKLGCEFDELSVDNKFNQILKATAYILLKHKEVKPARKAALKKLMPYFMDVSAIEVKNIKWNTMRFDRNCKTYRMLMYICYFVIDNMLLTTEKGEYMMNTFSDEHMCRLYEKFILEYFKRHHPETKARAAQIDWNIDKETSTVSILPILQTDILLELKGRTLIIDAKYYGKTWQEHYGKRTVHSHNLNQVFTYVMNYDCKLTGKVDGMLLYAKTQEEVVPDGKVNYNTGNTIYVKTLDLNQKFEGIKAQLDKLISYCSKD